MRFSIEQVTSRHISRYDNIAPRDIGLWVYIVDGRAYGFSPSEEGAIALAEAAVGIIN